MIMALSLERQTGKTMKKYKRARQTDAKLPPRTNKKGKVSVVVTLRDPVKGGHMKGNLTKSLTVNGSKVSIVFKEIEKMFFG